MRSFASFHPVVLFSYYISVLMITMLMMHPGIIVLSLLGSMLFYFMLTSPRHYIRELFFYLFVFLLISLTNPLFVHNGETILFFMNDNPITLEAIVFGIVIASMFIAVIFWSKSYSYLMTSDKFVYLFGRIIPKLSLVLSMALKFIPLFKNQIKKVHSAQKTLGLYTSNSIVDRILGGIRIFNSMLTWSLENAIHQADAMKARGYGLKGRTNFTIFKMEKRDIIALLFIIGLTIMITLNFILGNYTFFYYPVISSFEFDGANMLYLVTVFGLMLFPFILEVKENLQWKLLKSTMSASHIQTPNKK